MYAVESHCTEHSNGILKSQPGFAQSAYCFLCGVTSGYSFPYAQVFVSLDICVTECKRCKKTILIEGHRQHDHTEFAERLW